MGSSTQSLAMKPIYVLVACEESQAETFAFRHLGFHAYSCDIVECRRGGRPDWHIVGDATPYIQGCREFWTQSGHLVSVPRWDIIICHPPCTFLTKASAVALHTDPDTWIDFRGKRKYVNGDRLRKMQDARAFFLACYNANARYVAVENPIPMALANLPRPSCYADPSWFGVKYTKKTLYWTHNLPPLMAETLYPKPKCYVSASRGKYRSRTFPALAEAIARQWGSYVENDLRTLSDRFNSFMHDML